MRVALKDNGFDANIGMSILSDDATGFTPWLIEERAKALQSFLETDDGQNMLAGLKRAGNIVAAEEKKTKQSFNQNVNAALFTEDAEKALYEALEKARANIAPALNQQNYTQAMAEVAQLRTPIDGFLDNVMVNVDDEAIRNNRLNLLASIGGSLKEVADFSKLS